MNPTSLRRRIEGDSLLKKLVLRLTLATVAAVLLFLGFVYLEIAFLVGTLKDRSLTGQANDIARYLSVEANGELALDLPEGLARAYGSDDGQFMFQVRTPGGTLLLSSVGGAPTLNGIDSEESTEPRFFQLEKPGQGRVYAARVPIEGPSGPLFIRVGQGVIHEDVLLDQVLEEFLKEVAWLLIPLLVVLLAINIVTLKRGLASVKRASDLAASIGPGRRDVRLPEEGIPQEIRPLVHAVNSAFDRLEQGFRLQRDFTADAAHELRTPLSVLNAHLETLADRDAAKALRGDVMTMSRIVDQLLRVAHLDALSIGPAERADLHAIATDVAAYLAPLALKEEKSVAVTGFDRPIMVAGNKDSLYHAVCNLVENAIAHTPTGTTVEIDVGEDGQLSVSDRGAGIPADQRELIFRRFWRGEHSGERPSGAGLGLAIVARTTEAHGGSITVTDAPGGGANFVLRFPLAATAAAPLSGDEAA